MLARWILRLFVAVGALGSAAALAWVYLAPPASMRHNRDGVPHFTPPTVNPATGESIRVETLVEHFKGGAR